MHLQIYSVVSGSNGGQLRATEAHGARWIAWRRAVEALLAADDGRAVLTRHELARRAVHDVIVVGLTVEDGKDVCS